jgi:hypothetical protein
MRLPLLDGCAIIFAINCCTCRCRCVRHIRQGPRSA